MAAVESTAGAPDPKGKAPALDAVLGGAQNITIASPLAILQHGRVYTMILASQNNHDRDGRCYHDRNWRDRDYGYRPYDQGYGNRGYGYSAPHSGYRGW